jgi:hypothetical protein
MIGVKNVLTANGYEVLWRNHLSSLEREILCVAAKWREFLDPTERLQVIKSSFLVS